LAESFSQADGDRVLAESGAIEDEVAARHFYSATEAEQPAVEAKPLLGSVAVDRRVQCVARRLQNDDPILQLRGYKALAMATDDTQWEDMAFATLAEMIEAPKSQEGGM